MDRSLPQQHLLDQLSYVVIPSKLPINSPLVGLHNQAFNYWCEFWEKVFVDNGIQSAIRFRDEFCRKDLLCLVMHEKKVVGMHLCEFLNLNQDAFREHEYFVGHHTGGAFLDALAERKINYAMVMTYLTVDPDWRKSKIGISLAAVLMSLSTKVQIAAGTGVNLGRAREDVGVNKILTDLGGTVLKDSIQMYNTPVSMVCIYSNEVKDLTDHNARHYAERLWARRIDYSGTLRSEVGGSRVLTVDELNWETRHAV
jgi:hypothetical protein